jgi:hypothetical protein
MKIIRTEEEIDRLESWAAEGQDSGTRFSGMSYSAHLQRCGNYNIAGLRRKGIKKEIKNV